MQGAPVFGSQRHHGRTPHGGKDPDGLFQGSLGQVHQEVFLAAAHVLGLDPEQEVINQGLFFLAEARAGNQDGFGLEDGLHFLQAVGDQGAAGRDDVEDGIGDSHGRGDFHRSGDFLDDGVDLGVLEELPEDVRVGGGDAAAGEPLRSLVGLSLGDGEAQTAAAEAQPAKDIDLGSLFFHLVESHDAEGGRPAGDDPGNVVVPEIEGLDGEGLGTGKEFPLGRIDFDADVLEEGQALFVEPPLGLDGDPEHGLILFVVRFILK